MGNCFGSSSDGSSHNPRAVGSSTRSSIPATSSHYTSGGGTSVTGSSASQSRFSGAASGSLEDGFNSLRDEGQFLDTPNLREYTFSELKAATKNFKPDTLLGEGGFGLVYKGWVVEKTLAPSPKFGTGMMVAIKKLGQQSLHGFEEWQAEVNFLGTLSHPNLVKLLGYCWEGHELLLVYEYMQRGSMANHLFRRSSTVAPLAWDTRIKIAICAARGLAFLHTANKHVIHRDCKSSNILLDSDYNAKIADFGLAKFGPEGGESHVTTRVAGTTGYAAPEYVATGHLYIKSDVYGFGVVLLEFLTGLRAFDPRRPTPLVEWTKPYLHYQRKLKIILDARMKGYSMTAAFLAAQLALKCIAIEPKNRPSMKEVVEELEMIEALGPARLKKSTRNVASQNQHNKQPTRGKTQFHLKPQGAQTHAEKR